MTKSSSSSLASASNDNQRDERLAVWECEQLRLREADEPAMRALDALRLSLAKETTSGFVRNCDYMKQTQHHGLKDAWRVKICRWMFETGKAFELSVDTIGCAISLMDQFLCAESVDKVMMQLLSLVCVFIASKMHDPEPISLAELNLLCEGRFSRKDISGVEMHLLRIVNWELNPPNAFTFARDAVHALAPKNADEIVQSVTELLKFVAEDYDSIFCRSSSVALAAVQLTVGWQRGARCFATEPSASDDFVAAFNLVQRVHASTFDKENEEKEEKEEKEDNNADVSCSPVAVDGHPLVASVVEDVDALKQLLAAPSTPTQRALFSSPASKPSKTQSKKRQRAASMSLSH